MWSKLVGEHVHLILFNGVRISVEVRRRDSETLLYGYFFEVGMQFLPIIGLVCNFNFLSFSNFEVEVVNVSGGEIELGNRKDWYLIKTIA